MKQRRPAIIRQIRQFLRPLTFPAPIGIGALGGRGSRIAFPRSITNPQRIFIGSGTCIKHFSVINAIRSHGGRTYEPCLKIGDDVYIGGGAFIMCANYIEIRDGCVISEQVYLADCMHGLKPDHGLIMEQELECKGPVILGRSCFLGMRVSVLPNVELGDFCVVGAHSVVNRSFPAYSMIAGVPARLIKHYDPSDNQWKTV
ncbi:MAG: acyltransferase [Terracidiphilus sp.]|jgi:lipopolysaccharide O-acetyltransferase